MAPFMPRKSPTYSTICEVMPWSSEPADERLSEAMAGAWVRFATTGDPNGGDLPSWQVYDQETEPYLEFGETIRPGEHLLKAECDFFDRFVEGKRKPASP